MGRVGILTPLDSLDLFSLVFELRSARFVTIRDKKLLDCSEPQLSWSRPETDAGKTGL